MKVVFQSEVLDVPRKPAAVDDWYWHLPDPSTLVEVSGDPDLSRYRASVELLGYRFTLQNTFYVLPGRREHVYIVNFGLCFALPDLGFDILPEGREGSFNRVLQQLLSATPDYSAVLRRLLDAALLDFARRPGPTSRVEETLVSKFRSATLEQLNCSNDVYLEDRRSLSRWLTARQSYVWFLERKPVKWIREQPEYYDEITYSRELSLLYFLRYYGTFLGQMLVEDEGLKFEQAASLREDMPLWRGCGARIHAMASLPWEYQIGEEKVRSIIRSKVEDEEIPGVISKKKPSRIGHFGRYEVVERFSQGAMAEVYHGVDPVIGREVAIKALSIGNISEGDREEWWERFRREAKMAGSLSHPNIVTVYDVGEQDGVPYIVMQFLDGHDLREVFQQKREMSPGQWVGILSQVARALDYAHHKGVVHRDLKPANIMLLKDDIAVLTDFGIAAIRGSVEGKNWHLSGSIAYMSPEQIRGGQVDARSDIFSFGVTAFEVFYGRHPFPGSDDVSTIHRILEEEPDFEAVREPNILPGLEGVLRKALARDPAERYGRASDLAEALRTALDEAEALRSGKVIRLDGDVAAGSEEG